MPYVNRLYFDSSRLHFHYALIGRCDTPIETMRENLSRGGGGRRYACQVLRDAWRPPITSGLGCDVESPADFDCVNRYTTLGLTNSWTLWQRALETEKAPMVPSCPAFGVCPDGAVRSPQTPFRVTDCKYTPRCYPAAAFQEHLRQGTCVKHQMSEVKRVAIIGAGPAGAISIDAFAQEQAFDVIRVFERRERPGGCWCVYFAQRRKTAMHTDLP